MSRNYKYFLSLSPSVLVIAGNLSGGWWVGLNAAFSLILLALIERIVPENKSNHKQENSILPDALLVFHVIAQFFCIGTMLWSIEKYNFSFLQYLLLGLSVGINSGASSIVIAHEMIHRKNRWWKIAGKFLLFTAGNIYFFVNHLRIHHKWVGTYRDPATARLGENVYRFFFRTTAEQIRSSFIDDAYRLKKTHRFPFGMRNYVVGSLLMLAILMAAIFIFFGIASAALFAFQCLIANFLLEYTNYIEHYGLTRNENEKVSELISWQSDKLISRYFLIDLSRHSDHHLYASKPYHTLDSLEKSPVLPFGYASMIYYALIPPLWFRTVDPMIKK